MDILQVACERIVSRSPHGERGLKFAAARVLRVIIGVALLTESVD